MAKGAKRANLLQFNATDKMKKDIETIMEEEEKYLADVLRDAVEFYLKYRNKK